MDVNQIITAASNIRIGDNPAYTVDDFKGEYPQFAGKVPDTFLSMYVNLAHSSIQQERWGDSWRLAMGWFVAHFATLNLQSTTAANSPAAAVIAAGEAKGLITSESAVDVSYNQDFAAIADDLEGWAAWKLTIFGQQLATFGKLVGLGGMAVW